MKNFILIGLVLLLATPTWAGNSPFFKGEVQQKQVEHGLPKSVQNVSFDQHLGDQVTLSLPMRDEDGSMRTLGSYFGKRPVILVMAYYECPNLCTMVMNGVFGSLKALPFTAGKDFDVVSVSINPKENATLAMKKKNSYLASYHQTEQADGFHFLTSDEASIETLAKQVGFRYSYDSINNQYAHAAGIIVLTPDGKLSRYFFGVEFSPKDLKFGLIDASGGKIGSVADKLLMFCYHYDPSDGKYGAAIQNILRIGGVLTLLAMGGMFLAFRRYTKSRMQLQIGKIA